MLGRGEQLDFIEGDYSFEGKDAKSEGVVPSPVSLVPEEKVSFGLYALSVSALTVARIRKVCNKLDSKAIAKQVSGMISRQVVRIPTGSMSLRFLRGTTQV